MSAQSAHAASDRMPRQIKNEHCVQASKRLGASWPHSNSALLCLFVCQNELESEKFENVLSRLNVVTSTMYR
jgi:hypothetical protein